MPKRTTKRCQIGTFNVTLPLGSQLQLDYLVDLYEAFRPQVEGLRFGRVTRAVIVRCALSYLEEQARLGNVGPELLRRAGQDRRAGRVSPRRAEHDGAGVS